MYCTNRKELFAHTAVHWRDWTTSWIWTYSTCMGLKKSLCHSAWLCYRRVFCHDSLLYIGHFSWPLIPISWSNAQILRRHTWPLTNPTLYVVSKTPAVGHSTLLLVMIQHIWLVIVTKKQIDMSFYVRFALTARHFSFFFKEEQNLKNLPLPFGRPMELSIFVEFFKIYLLTQSL
jgi:hypothetical protein